MPEKLLLRSAAVLLCLGFATVGAETWLADAAWAQDDDDDDGDDDDDDDGGSTGGGTGGGPGGGTGGADDDGADDVADDDAAGGSAGGGAVGGVGSVGGVGTTDDVGQPATGNRQPRKPVASVRAPDELPLRVEGEIVTLALTDADLSTLINRGFRILEERPVPEIGIIARRLAIPDDTTLEAARDLVRALTSGSDADFNGYYRTEEEAEPEPALCEGAHCATRAQIGWTVSMTTGSACATDVMIGVIDTGINPDHAAFASARLDVHRLAPESLDPSRAIHGTAVISVLIGSPDSRSPGLLPDTQVVAVDAFHIEGGDERADVYTLAAAMDFLADRGVRVINMSLAGPPNSVLEAATSALLARGVVLVAAVGNGGPSAPPSYPAAYPGVIAVTAVDSGDTVYRRAGRGPHVDLAAPGVEVWTAASVSGAKPKTGTSFAAPFVTAAAASLLELNPDMTPEAVTTALGASVRDLGEPGKDEVFGFGLIQARQLCLP